MHRQAPASGTSHHERPNTSFVLGQQVVTCIITSFLQAKIFKTQMHRFVDIEQYDVVVWLDATVLLINPETAHYLVRLVDAGRNFITFEHFSSRRGSVAEEVASSRFTRYLAPSEVYGPAQDVDGQYAGYLAEGFTEKWWLSEYDAPMGIKNRPEYGMWVTCFVAYDARSRGTTSFLNAWWAQIVQGSTQDQVSFPYVAWKQKAYPFSLPTNSSGVVISGTCERNSIYEKLDHNERR